MVITVEIDKFAITNILVDQGSSSIFYIGWLSKRWEFQTQKSSSVTNWLLDSPVSRWKLEDSLICTPRLGKRYFCKTIKVVYLLVNENTSYNILLGRSSINRLQAIVSTPHLVMKFVMASGDIVTVHVDQKTTRECYVASLKIESTSRLYKTSPRGRSMGKRGCSPRCRETTKERSRDRTKENMVAFVILNPARTFAIYLSEMTTTRHTWECYVASW